MDATRPTDDRRYVDRIPGLRRLVDLEYVHAIHREAELDRLDAGIAAIVAAEVARVEGPLREACEASLDKLRHFRWSDVEQTLVVALAAPPDGGVHQPAPPPGDGAVKCRYCDNPATMTLVWLKDKNRRPARIKLPWCGCDLQVALRRFWPTPYRVVEGVDYEVDRVSVVPLTSAPQ